MSLDVPRAWRTAKPLAVPLLLVALVCLVVLVVSGLLLVHVLDGVARSDLRLERHIASNRTATRNTLTMAGTWLAETIPVVTITVIGVVVAWLVTRSWRWPLFLATVVAGEKLVYLIASVIVGRDRPPVPTVGHTYATRSFPSGHVGASITLYGGLVVLATMALRSRHARRQWRRIGLALVAVIAAIVAYCRMYRGFHYPIDVAAGAALGAVWLAACWYVLLRPVEQRAVVSGQTTERSTTTSPMTASTTMAIQSMTTTYPEPDVQNPLAATPPGDRTASRTPGDRTAR